MRFLKACREATVWPRRPSELVTLAQSSLRAAERCGRNVLAVGGKKGIEELRQDSEIVPIEPSANGEKVAL